MPFAGTSHNTITHNLKSAAGGWVVLRRLTYGEKLRRKNMMKLGIEMGSKSKDVKGEIAMASREATVFDFKSCIVDHNLFKDEAETVQFDFTSAMDVEMLDPRIGEEIEQAIDKLNNFEADDEAKN